MRGLIEELQGRLCSVVFLGVGEIAEAYFSVACAWPWRAGWRHMKARIACAGEMSVSVSWHDLMSGRQSD